MEINIDQNANQSRKRTHRTLFKGDMGRMSIKMSENQSSIRSKSVYKRHAALTGDDYISEQLEERLNTDEEEEEDDSFVTDNEKSLMDMVLTPQTRKR